VHEKSRTPNFEAQLLEAHVRLRAMPKRKDGSATATLARHGANEVRLHEHPADVVLSGEALFRLELFDHRTQTTVENYAGNDLEDAATALERLVNRAKQLANDEAGHS
jgi:hypothetical protein